MPGGTDRLPLTAPRDHRSDDRGGAAAPRSFLLLAAEADDAR